MPMRTRGLFISPFPVRYTTCTPCGKLEYAKSISEKEGDCAVEVYYGEAIEDGFMNVHPMLFEDIRNAVVDVPCTECPFREVAKDGSVSWTDNKPSTLVRLSFQSLHGSSFFFLGHAWLTKNRLWTLPSMITA